MCLSSYKIRETCPDGKKCNTVLQVGSTTLTLSKKECIKKFTDTVLNTYTTRKLNH